MGSSILGNQTLQTKPVASSLAWFKTEYGLWVALTLFIGSRVGYVLLGQKFDIQFAAVYGMHVLSPDLLLHDLWRSIFYLHGQPPIFNLFNALILRLSPGDESIGFQISYWIFGLILTVTLYTLMRELRINSVLSTVITVVFMIGPSVLFYETRSFYEYFVITQLSLSALLFAKYFHTRKSAYLYSLFAVLGLIVLTRTAFHILWLVACLGLVLFFERKQWNKVFLAFLIPFIICFGWYAKNYFVFGQFTNSTWFGLNLGRISTYALPRNLRDPLIAQGKLSALAGLTSVFDYPLNQHQDIKTGIPALDQVYKTPKNFNYNNINVIAFSQQCLKDALTVIRLYPKQYIFNVFYATMFYFQQSSFFSEFTDTPRLIQTWENIEHVIFFQPWFKLNGSMVNDPNVIIRSISRVYVNINLMMIGYAATILVGGVYLLKSLFKKVKTDPNQPIFVFLIFTLIYITFVSNIAEMQMNYRFRFMADPYFWVLTGVGLNWLWGKVKARFSF